MSIQTHETDLDIKNLSTTHLIVHTIQSLQAQAGKIILMLHI